MSENSNELGLVADAPGHDSKRKLLLVGGGAFVAVALVARLVLGGGAEDTVTVGAPSPAAAASPATQQAPPVVPASFTGVVGKDPFTPVVEPPPPPPPSAPPAPPAPPPSPSPAPPQVVVVQAPAPTGPKTLRVTQVVPAGASYRVTLTVNGQLYDVAFGQTFADTFAAQSLSAPGCVRFAHGEEPFDLCEGMERTF